ncbi:DMT family transporter [Pseudomonas sp. 5P_3.1_Bac2]|uniref:DMT family transporter n=1 Tax=Pseudomonas sp. 5P_3.1_Bac2 TaxID=2971617 RepID=UPI0021C5E478|nr:DMT family transporter [Pseudomonas sp. 5P_3.1_Bac2]MCU1716104.1 DMT family transporter [Pseudomonas sp. 5P_3.1_Bac2]
MTHKHGQGGAMLCLLLAMALWGSSFIALKLAFAELPALWVIFGRMALGSLIFLLAWRWRGALEYRAGDWKYLLAMGVCEPCLYFLCEAIALQHTSAAQAGMVTALMPLLVTLGAWLVLGERTTQRSLLGFAIAIGGALWLSLAGNSDEHASNPLLGNFFELLAVLCAVAYTLLLKHLSTRYSAFFLTALMAFIGCGFFLPAALIYAPVPAQLSLKGALAVAYLGVLVTVGAYGLYNYGVGRLPASQASAFLNLIPLFTLVFAVLVLGERLNAEQLLAALLVFAGVMLSQWRSKGLLPAGTLD